MLCATILATTVTTVVGTSGFAVPVRHSKNQLPDHPPQGTPLSGVECSRRCMPKAASPAPIARPCHACGRTVGWGVLAR
jgi:hypothetical protein